MIERMQKEKEKALKLLEDADRALAQIFINQDGVMQMAAARMMLKQAGDAVEFIDLPEPEGIAAAERET